jgi:hypothetical protein
MYYDLRLAFDVSTVYLASQGVPRTSNANRIVGTHRLVGPLDHSERLPRARGEIGDGPPSPIEFR